MSSGGGNDVADGTGHVGGAEALPALGPTATVLQLPRVNLPSVIALPKDTEGKGGSALMGLLATATERSPLVAAGKSGAPLERVRLADGQVLVVKHVNPGIDWIMRATGDRGRIGVLWSSGTLSRLPAVIDHAVLSVIPLPPTAWVVVMRDLSGKLFDDGRRLSRADSRRILAAVAELHAAFRAPHGLEELAPLAELYRFLSPAAAGHLAAQAHVPRLAVRGWKRFFKLVPSDVAAAVARVHERPESLAHLLSRHPCTLVHGDLKMANLGFVGDRIAVLDWGSLTTWAPAAVDYAWFLAVNGASIDARPDEVLEDVRRAQGDAHDEEAMRLALLGALAQLGWEKALGATGVADEGVRRRERDGLDWWTARAREGLEVWDRG